MGIHQNDSYFLTFLVVGRISQRDRPARVLLARLGQDPQGLGRSLRDRGIAPDDTDAKLGWLLVVGTIPAGILGLTLEHSLRRVFASPTSAAIFLMCNDSSSTAPSNCAGARPRSMRMNDARIARQMTWGGAFGVGAVQALALIPGFSRSGATMGGGLLMGSRIATPRALLPARHADHRRGRDPEAAPSCSGITATASADRRSSEHSARRSPRGWLCGS